MRYVLDSNIVLFYARNSDRKRIIEKEYQPFAEDNTAIISIVTVAELTFLHNNKNGG